MIRGLLCAVLACGLTAPGWGQVVGASLSGTVRDATGAALPGAGVVVRNLETGAERHLVADDGGR